MHNGEIVNYSHVDSAIERFRLRVLIEDLNCDPAHTDKLTNHSDFKTLFAANKHHEEIYKFSKQKWNEVKFDCIFGLVINDEVVSMSGCKWYGGQYLRLGMHYYTLKAYRKIQRSPLWRQNGFVDNAMQEFPDAENYFISIYPHNQQLKAWVSLLLRNKQLAQLGNTDQSVLCCIRNFKIWPELVRFNNVDQLIMIHPGFATETSDSFFRELKGRIS